MSKPNRVDKYPKVIKYNKGNLPSKENTLGKENTPSKVEELDVPQETINPTVDASSQVDDSNDNEETRDPKVNAHVWMITALTNLHVGNENTSNYGIIDNAIQRDVLTDIPCINSSSLKGALNEFCSVIMTGGDARDARIRIFGSDKNDRRGEKDKEKEKGKGEEKEKGKGNSQKGKSIFFDAQLLFLPKQEDRNLYSYVTSGMVLDLFEKKVGMFIPGFTMNDLKDKGIWVDDLVKDYFGLDKSLEIIENAEFAEYCNDENLPIIARNELKNGMSNNLWYEQVLPPQTRLCAITIDEDETLADVVDKKIVQIGANATIGYGYCQFSKVAIAKSKG